MNKVKQVRMNTNLNLHLSLRFKLIIIITSALIILLIVMFQLNSNSLKVTNFSFCPDRGATVSEMSVMIEYKNQGKDRISVSMGIFSDSLIQGKQALFLVSSDYLNPEYSNFGDGIKHSSYCADGERRENFECNSKNCYFRQGYNGKVFEKFNSEISNKFVFSFGFTSKDIEHLHNAKIAITGLSSIDINKVFPEPDFNNVHAIIYDSPKKIKEVFEYGITFKGEDNSKKHSNQNWIFVVGTLIGVLFSILATLGLELFSHKLK